MTSEPRVLWWGLGGAVRRGGTGAARVAAGARAAHALGTAAPRSPLHALLVRMRGRGGGGGARPPRGRSTPRARPGLAGPRPASCGGRRPPSAPGQPRCDHGRRPGAAASPRGGGRGGEEADSNGPAPGRPASRPPALPLTGRRRAWQTGWRRPWCGGVGGAGGWAVCLRGRRARRWRAAEGPGLAPTPGRAPDCRTVRTEGVAGAPTRGGVAAADAGERARSPPVAPHRRPPWSARPPLPPRGRAPAQSSSRAVWPRATRGALGQGARAALLGRAPSPPMQASGRDASRVMLTSGRRPRTPPAAGCARRGRRRGAHPPPARPPAASTRPSDCGE